MSENPAARWDVFWWIAGIVLVLVASLSLCLFYWEELRGNQESLSTTVRNVGLVIGGAIAILFAVWRSIVAEKQAKTAQRGLLNERYQKGAEMLGSELLAVRLGGIYALARLAREHPRDYHTQIMGLLCAFIHHHPAVEKEDQDDPDQDDPTESREDFWKIIHVIAARGAGQIEIERTEKYSPDLSELNLSGAYLSNANLANADLKWTNLIGATLEEANLANANLFRAILSGATLKGCRGLTQEQINQTSVRDGKLPKLEGVVDANTNKPLV